MHAFLRSIYSKAETDVASIMSKLEPLNRLPRYPYHLLTAARKDIKLNNYNQGINMGIN